MIGLLSSLVRDKIPSYLESFPIPRSFSGFLELSAKDWLHLIVVSGAVGAVGYIAAKPYIEDYRRRKGDKDEVVNLTIKKDSTKVVDIIDIESLGDKASFCRCWRSKKFPYCDGAHTKHNKQTGDNVGPLCLKRGS